MGAVGFPGGGFAVAAAVNQAVWTVGRNQLPNDGADVTVRVLSLIGDRRQLHHGPHQRHAGVAGEGLYHRLQDLPDRPGRPQGTEVRLGAMHTADTAVAHEGKESMNSPGQQTVPSQGRNEK
jgi:hypothetical protein